MRQNSYLFLEIRGLYIRVSLVLVFSDCKVKAIQIQTESVSEAYKLEGLVLSDSKLYCQLLSLQSLEYWENLF